MKHIFKLTFIALFVLLVSCNKDENTNNPTTKELITSAAWKVTNFSSLASDPVTLSVLKDWNDDLVANPLFVTYNSNGTYLYSDSSDYGTWELSGDKTIIFEKGTANQLTSTIDNITSTSFIITYPWAMSDSLTVNVTEKAVR